MWFRRNNGVKRNGYRSRWKTAGIILLCIVFGLALGVGAGFLVQREFGGSKSSEASRTKAEAEKQDKEDSEEKSKSSEPEDVEEAEAEAESSSTAPSTTPSASTLPSADVKGKTPAEAMNAYLKAIGREGNGMMFSVVSASKTDPNWKLDKGVKSGETLYFIVHYTNGSWTVEAAGPHLTAEDMASVGAPTDLKPVP